MAWNDDKMEPIESLLPQVLPQVDGCPISMAKDAIQAILVDFCKQTGVWQINEIGLCGAGDTQVFFPLPNEARLCGIESAKLGGLDLLYGEMSITPNGGVYLKQTQSQEVEMTARLVLRPARNAERIPAYILEEYGDTIAFGAVGKLKSMTGNNIAWSDASGAQINAELYNEGIGEIRTRLFRNKKGGGTLIANG